MSTELLRHLAVDSALGRLGRAADSASVAEELLTAMSSGDAGMMRLAFRRSSVEDPVATALSLALVAHHAIADASGLRGVDESAYRDRLLACCRQQVVEVVEV